MHCNAEFARSLGFERETVNDLLVFHTVFGKSVPDVSLNAVANLGYADVRFGAPVLPGDTLSATTTVLGRRESRGGDTGVVWVRTTGVNQRGEEVLTLIRWVLVNKRDPESPPALDDAPEVPDSVAPEALHVPDQLDLSAFSADITGGRAWWEEYEPGERIDHVEGMAIEEAEQQIITRLYQNTARAHFNAHALQGTRFGRRVIYGGHIISVARALSFNGLENAGARARLQRRHAQQPDVRRRHALRVDRGARTHRPRPRRRRRAAPAPRRDEGRRPGDRGRPRCASPTSAAASDTT